jgi:serine/threonine protein kinase
VRRPWNATEGVPYSDLYPPAPVTPTASPTRTTNEPIPGYKLVKRIGAGGYGEVWAAEAPGELVKAIKFVYGLLDEDRAAREMKALNRIKGVRHPFLLSLERIEVVEGQLLIVTELAECSLKDRFDICKKAGQGGISRDELLSYMRDSADALDYMSEQHSLQHLDVKPENLLMLGGRIKVADFGLVKDIHDHTASMMGGLTPVYAPPEVFEGRPSRKSDQYSLAIVFQEMLTGQLPFPGRTAAQLAAQHLNAKPRMAGLSEADQAIIGRALAKKPADRFGSCKEMIQALESAGREPVPRPSAAAPAAGPGATEVSGMQTSPRLPSEMISNLDAATRAIQRLTSPGLLQPTSMPTNYSRPMRMTHSRKSLSADEAASLLGPTPELAALEAAPSLVDLPPLETDAQAPPLRPTLFIGLGGCGGQVLRRLRSRLDDRLPAELRMLAPMLLLDTDTRDLANSAHGEGHGLLKPEEMLGMPLRRSQDYREDSRKILEWLSRRWLYNIPRSQQTEGLRPLGRLALADHAPAATARIKQAIGQLHEQTTALQLAPRVVIVASPCGGTGGGMVTDIAFLARQLLDTLPDGEGLEVLAVLVHGTTRNPQQQELAAANTVATLTELAQFHRPGAVFPGDPACGLSARPAGSGALSAVYLMHAGEELSPAEMDAAGDRVAEFLMLDTITQTGNALEAARAEEGDTLGLPLRSFGLYEFGFAHDRLLDDSVHRVCRAVVQRLSGPTQTPEMKKPGRLLSGGAPSADVPSANPLAELDQRAATLARTMGLDVEPLMQVVQQFSAADMGGDAEAFFRKLMVGGKPGMPPPVEKWVAAACDLFGRQHTDTSIQAQPGELAQALDQRVGPWIAQVGTGLREWIEAIVEDPHCRVTGAKRAAKWFQNYLKALVDRIGETRGRLARDTQAVMQLLAATNPQGKGPRRTPAEIATAFLQYCRLRLFELAAQRAGQIAHSLQSHAVAAHDALVDLQRDLDHLAAQFPVSEAMAATPPAASEVSAMRTSVSEQLRLSEEPLSREIEELLIQALFAKQGGMRAVVSTGGEVREQLVTLLRTSARQAALAKVQSIDLASLLLTGQNGESPLTNCLASAEPWLQRCGGRRRLLFVIPQQLVSQYNSATLAAQLGSTVFKQLPGIAAGGASDLVLLIELGDISVAHAAAHLIDFRRDLAEAASRLQTRSDVTWTPVFAF